MKSPVDLLDQIAAAAPIAPKLAQVRAGEAVSFEHVLAAAQPFLTAVLARQVKQRVWIVCANTRAQETFHNELLQWFPDALFFPEAEVSLVEGALPDPESTAERLGIIQKLTTGKGRQVIVMTRGTLEDLVPSPAALRQLEIRLKRAAELDREALVKQLAGAGYEHVAQVAARGQFAVRGGILDVFSFHHSLPIRIELFEDEIESIREFDLDTQTSVQTLDTCTLLLGEAAGERGTCRVHELMKEADLTIDADAGWFAAQVQISESALGGAEEMHRDDSTDATAEAIEGTAPAPVLSSSSVASVASSRFTTPGSEDYSTAFFDHGLGEFEAGDFVIDELKRERFFSQLREWRTAGWRVHIFCNNEGEIERLHDLLPPVEADPLTFTVGTLSRGFTFPAAKVAVLSDAELFGRYRNTRARRLALRRAREQSSRTQIDFSELNEDDYVVHLEHGIGRYEGMKSIPGAEGKTEEVLVVAFAEEAKLYVPLEQSFLVSRYVGVGKRNPPLSVLGDGKWSKAKKNAEKAVFDYAGKLLQLHAERETAVGHAFPPDNKWQREFEASFLFKETPDQLTAIAAAKADMESERPMDRLICGDVGFGKTEVAIRTAFKSVMGGKQVAILVPTTVL
ncbi:MAG TPA: CarD family transcriptional regulator, partial [Chthoniobacteraceae bacterium]